MNEDELSGMYHIGHTDIGNGFMIRDLMTSVGRKIGDARGQGRDGCLTLKR